MERRHVSTGSDWERRVGYSRAVRIGDGGNGDRVLISGTTAASDGSEYAPNDPSQQTRTALANLQTALTSADSCIEDVVRTRLFVTDIDAWKQIGDVHGEVFGGTQPATSMVEVSDLIEAELVVEIEAEAVVGSGNQE